MSSISLNFKKSVDVAKQKLQDRLKTNKWLLWLLVAIPIAGGLSYLAYNQLVTAPQQRAQQKVQTAAVTRGNLAIVVSANGTVQPESSVNVSPKTAGILKELLVKEGDFVKPGQIVAYMDNSNLQGQLLQSTGNLAAAQANLDKVIAGNRSQDIGQAQANLNKVQATYGQAAEDLRRNQKLQAQGAISQQALSLARSTSDGAQAQVEQAQQALNLLNAGSRPEDIAQARAQVMAAQGTVAIAQRNIDDTVIRAPFAGIVARKYADPGAFVTPTTAGSAVTSATSSSILALASTNEIVAQVAEASIAQIRVGQVAMIKVDAYAGKTFEGKVTQVATQSLVQQNVTSFEVKVAVTDSQKLLHQGMNVAIDFRAGELNQVLIVPTASIVQQKTVQGVFVAKTGGDPVFTPVVVGTTINDKTEVKSGLTGNEQVLLSFPPGTRKASSGFN